MSVLMLPSLTVAKNKQHFFSSGNTAKNAAVLNDVNGAPIDYAYIEKHLFWINQEYKHLSAILDDLEKNTSTSQEELKRVQERCHYFSKQLLMHAQVYHGPRSAEAQKYRKKISTLIGEKPSPDDPVHMSTSILRDWLSAFDIYRLHIVFSRITWKQFWLLGRELHWLDKSDKLGGILPINIGIMDAPTAVFNVLSVVFFASRFMVNFAMLLKHTFEKNDGVLERFWNELKKRHWVMVNDLVWAIVNGLTNYALYFNMTAVVASWVLAAFLVFDFFWLIYRVYLEEQNYLSTKAYYEHQMEELSLDDPDRAILQKQLSKLNDERHEMNGTLGLCMAAALLIMASFASALLIGSPIALPVCFFFCIVAISMYMSSGKFGAYVKELMRDNPDKTAQSNALMDFTGTLVKNALAPLFIIGLFTISWQAALVMAVLYVGYELSVSAKPAAAPAKSVGLSGLFKPVVENSELENKTNGIGVTA